MNQITPVNTNSGLYEQFLTVPWCLYLRQSTLLYKVCDLIDHQIIVS